MHRFCFTLVLAALLMQIPAIAQPPGQFERLNPPMPIEDLWNARKIGQSTVEIAGTEHIFRTTNRGITWKEEPVDSVRINSLKSAKWLNDQEAWTKPRPYFTDSIMKYTSDGGLSWSEVNAHVEVTDFSFVSNREGAVVTNRGYVLRTNDGGKTWSAPFHLIPQRLESIWRASDNVLLVPIPAINNPGGQGGLFRSTDRGLTWDTLDFTHLDSFAHAKAIVNTFWPISERGFRVMAGNRIYETSNQGNTWMDILPKVPDAKSNPDLESEILSIYSIDADRAWARGYYDEVFFSSDGGRNWVVQDTGSKPKELLNGGYASVPKIVAIVSLSAERALLFGQSGILRSFESQAGWANLNTGFTPNHLTAVAFSSRDTGFVGGLLGSMYRTMDGGRSWESVMPETKNSFVQSISVRGSNVLMILSHDTVIYRSSDLGQSWESTAISGLRPRFATVFRYLEKVQHISPTVAFVVGFKGNALKTVDAGITWSKLVVQNSPISYHDLSFVNENTGWIAGDSGVVYRTTNGGADWELQWTEDVLVSGAQLHSIDFSDELHGVAGGNNGRIFTTSNGGMTWERGRPGVDMSKWTFGGFQFLKLFQDGTVWAGIDEGKEGAQAAISWSSDRGLTWTPDTIISRIHSLNGMSFPNEDVGYFVSGKGLLLKWSASKSSVDDTGSRNQYLDIRISPTPVQQLVNCTVYGLYSVKDHQSVRFKIYDLLGREVMDLSNLVQSRSNGKHSSFNFSSSSLASGVYISHLITSNGSKSVTFQVTR